MADMDVFSAMGIVGFGKAAKKRELDPNRFDKTRREELVVSFIVFRLPLSSDIFHPLNSPKWRRSP
jgi:hypothetical protein